MKHPSHPNFPETLIRIADSSFILKGLAIYNWKLLTPGRETADNRCGVDVDLAEGRDAFKAVFVPKPLVSDIEPGPFHNWNFKHKLYCNIPIEMSEVINEEEWKVPFSIQPPSLTCQISFPISMKLGCFPTFFRDSKYCACVEAGGGTQMKALGLCFTDLILSTSCPSHLPRKPWQKPHILTTYQSQTRAVAISAKMSQFRFGRWKKKKREKKVKDLCPGHRN